MKKSLVVTVTLLTHMLVAQGQDTHWGYSGDVGPDVWGSLDSKFSACGEGRNQSPIDLDALVEADVPALEFNYVAGGNEVVNNGHTVQVNYEPGSQITVEGREFELKQFHFHTPSEHHVKGKGFPMEAHFVHADKDGNLAVVGVMFEEGAANPGLEAAREVMPEKPGKEALNGRANAEVLLPEARDHYRYSGSLTTPPCSEGVVWLLMKQAMTASRDQIDEFSSVMGHANNRPLQPVNARLPLQ